jgi:hypothetical protein
MWFTSDLIHLIKLQRIIIIIQIIIFITLIIIWNLLDQSWYDINNNIYHSIYQIIIYLLCFKIHFYILTFLKSIFIYSHQNIHSCKKEIIIFFSFLLCLIWILFIFFILFLYIILFILIYFHVIILEKIFLYLVFTL